MNNKVLVNLEIPEIECSFNVFIPVNEIIWRVKKMLIKSVSDLIDTNFNSEEYFLVNKNNGKIYKNNDIVLNTDIKNTSELILMSKK